MKNLCLLLSLFVTIQAQESGERIRLYSFYTPSHAPLKQWFESSIKDDYEVIINFAEQECHSAKFMQSGWKKTTGKKIDHIIEEIEENMGGIFVYADIDIQFFRPTKPHILKALENNDLVFQKDRPSGTICSGFFACRANQRTLEFWKDVRKYMYEKDRSDQAAVNAVIRKKNDKHQVRWALLPDEFFGGGTLTGKEWVPGKSLPVPQNIILHHANWTVGVVNKLAQLRYVKRVVKGRQKYARKYYTKVIVE